MYSLREKHSNVQSQSFLEVLVKVCTPHDLLSFVLAHTSYTILGHRGYPHWRSSSLQTCQRPSFAFIDGPVVPTRVFPSFRGGYSFILFPKKKKCCLHGMMDWQYLASNLVLKSTWHKNIKYVSFSFFLFSNSLIMNGLPAIYILSLKKILMIYMMCFNHASNP